MNDTTVAEQEDRTYQIDTDINLDDYRVVVLALTGPPAAGKSTAVSMLRDMGIPCKDTGEAIRDKAHERYDDPNEDQIWSEAELLREKHGGAAPVIVAEDWIKNERAHGHEVVCISSLREHESVEWLRANVGATLCVRIEASLYDRSQRYVETKMDEGEVASKEREKELTEEILEREQREKPYPQHDLLIENPNSTGMRQLWEQLENTIEVLRA